jgi:hypothetical protein
MTAPDRILSASVIRLVADDYRTAINARKALIEAAHPEPPAAGAPASPVLVYADECAEFYRANRIDGTHLALAEAILAHRPRRRHWWWPW